MKLIDDLVSASILPIAEFSMGLDGTTYSIAISNGFNRSEYTWWEECPKEWQMLGKFAENLLQFVKIK
jgi:hypothetical protein